MLQIQNTILGAMVAESSASGLGFKSYSSFPLSSFSVSYLQ